MQEFKFFNKKQTNDYDGEWSQMAVRIVADYVAGRFTSGQTVQTPDAEYVISQVSYQRGELASAIVEVTSERSSFKVTYYITMGRAFPFITGHSITNQNN